MKIFNALFAFLLAPVLLPAAPPDSAAAGMNVWFGTTTPRKGEGSKGIYHARFDPEKGRLSPVRLAAEVGSPGFLALHPDGSRLYAACRVDGEPAVAGYRIGDNGDLERINHQPIGDGGAAHLAVHSAGRMVITAQYGGGSVAVFPLDGDGKLAPRSALHEHDGGSKVVGRRQDAPHAHWVGFDPAGEYAFVPDLGLDAVVIYRVTGGGTGLEPVGRAACPPGGGPRHMKFSGDYAYVLNELALSVTSFRYHGGGRLERLGTVPALSEETKAQEAFNSASEIRVHPSGRFVYSANRGHDSITVYRAKDGALEVVEVEPVRGAWPRNFALDPSGRWLLAAGRDSDTVAVFGVDPETGRLQYRTRSIVRVPSPICVLFGN